MASLHKFKSYLPPLAALLLFAGAACLVHRELAGIHYHEIVASWQSIPIGRLSLSLVAALTGYVALSGYDALGLRYAGKALAYPKILLTSFISFVLSNNFGFAAITGGLARTRLYSMFGIAVQDAATVTVFSVATFWLGIALIGGIALVVDPLPLPVWVHLPWGLRALGLLLLAGFGAYCLATVFLRRPLHWRGREVALPEPRFLIGQILVATLDWSAVSLALYLLLPPQARIGYFAFVAIFLLAQLLGISSNIPGGVGVFEAAMLFFLPREVPRKELIAALLAFRAVYYLVPLGMATLLLFATEGFRKRKRIGQGVAWIHRFTDPLAPLFAASVVFLSGILLLVSGSTRGLPHRLEWLSAFVPVGVVEASHFLASVVGVGLLLLARGLRYRLRTAYHVAMILLLTGAILSLLKGLDFEETCLLALTAALLLPVKSHFSRRSKLRDLAFTPAWTISIAIVLVGVFALGLFSYKHVEYSNDLWWRFTLHGNASRFLRAFVGVFATIAGFGAWKLLGPPGSRGAEIPVGSTDFVDLVPIVRADPGTSAHLVLVGDKSVLFHPSRKSFIMFRSQGRSLVCMGDPVGREEDRAELVWMFKAHCDRFASHPVFYQVSPECLPLYIDIGLAFLKLGEEAMVDLGSFDLAGATHKGMRANFRRLARDDVEFSILAPDQVASRMSELRSVSDAWMASKQAKEKGFSLGFFDEAYLALCPVAIAKVQGAIVAFANLWEAGDRQELSVDLMRYAPSAPKGVMDFLFASILEHGRDQGWKRFNLGMAPLSGLEGRRLAPHWSKAGHFLFSHGEGLYNFRGLRHYKEKFHPAWEPRYLAYPGGLTLPGVLANLALLISRGSNR